MATHTREENQGEENTECGAARDQEGLSHKVTFEKDLKEVKEQVVFGEEREPRAKDRQEHGWWIGATWARRSESHLRARLYLEF